MHRYRILTAVALAGLLFTACEDDWLGGKSADKNTVSFTLQTSGIATRSDARPAEESVIATHVYDLHDTSPEGEPLMLVETVTAIGDEEEGCNGYTRGVEITTNTTDGPANKSSFYDSFSNSGFTGISYGKDGSAYIKNDQTAQFKPVGEGDNCVWTYTYKNNMAWVDDGIYYVLYAGKNLNGLSNVAYSKTSDTDGTVTFNYTMPSASSASSHEDLLFTTKHIQKDQAGIAQPITFYHMLTALRFKDGYKGEGTSVNNITSVTLKGLYNQGTCSFQANPDYNENGNGIKKSSDFLYDITWNSSGSAQDITLTSPTENLWVVPQSVATGHSMTMEVKYKFGNGSVHTKEITFPAGTVWNAGERHTFSINPVNVVPAVTVTGPSSGQYTATITNTGNYPVYLRAAIVPTWTDGSGNVINVPWEGNIEFSNSDWVYYSADGYYYKKTYLEKVGLSTPANSCTLSFTPTASSTPSGATLKVDVAVQSVASKDMKEDNTASADKFTAIGWKKYVTN